MKRRDFLKTVTGVAAGAMVPASAFWSTANADARSATLLIVSESGPNNIDIMGVGTNVPGYEVSWNCYDRLITHEMKEGPGGVQYYDRDKFKGELAESFTIDDKSATFKLRKNAKFHDGTPITAKDVKWSLDRSVSVGGFPTFQMSAGSLKKPEQFVIVDDYTVRVDFITKDRLTIPDLAVIVPCIMNSELIKKNATEKDPWGLEYTKQNIAGGGAYKVTKWTAGTEVIMERNDHWVCGPLPKIKRVIWRMVPQAGNRRALLERGDADMSYELPYKDFQEIKANGKLKVVSLPFSNGIQYIGMNVTKPPFDNPKVRQALAYAIPYQKIVDAVLFGLGNPMYGASADRPTEVAWPQPTKFNTDIAKAKALLAEAGYPNGFETTLSFRAVDGISFTVGHGESVGLVGESGCGKSTTSMMVMRLIDKTSGNIVFDGDDIGAMAPNAFARLPLRKSIQMVFQDPTDSLNPRFTAARAIADPLMQLGDIRGGDALRAKCEDLARQVGLPLDLLDRFPHQMSGGQKARVGIARAIALQPKLIILDEPTAALDVSVQAVVLNLLQDLKQSMGMSYLFVSHDLNVVRLLCDRVIVMRSGRIVEQGPTEAVLDAPQDDYTRELLSAIPHPPLPVH